MREILNNLKGQTHLTTFIKAQGIGEGAALDTSKKSLNVSNQLIPFLQRFVNSSLTTLCRTMHNERPDPVLSFPIWFWRRFLATPEKMATHLEVVDAKTGSKMSVAQSIGRYFAYIISALPLCLGFIWVGIDNKKQGWHDKLAGTVVIRNNSTEPVTFDN